MLFKQLSTKWAKEICETAGETDEYKIALTRYVFESILSFILSFLVLFLAAWALGILKQALIIGFTGAILKSFTGGLHMNTPLRCAVWGAVSLIAISYLSMMLPLASIPVAVVVVFLGVSNVIVWLKAPREAHGKPLSDKQKVVLGILSRIIILVISVIILFRAKTLGMNEIFYGTVFHTFNLLDLTARGTEKLDNLFEKIEKTPVF